MTFDDGPSNHTEELLNILKDADAKATFFVSGNNSGKGAIDTTEKWTQLIKRMEEDGHQIGSHTWSHPDLSKMSSEARKNDMAENERALVNILGKYPTYMRPPYVRCGHASGCLADMKDLGYHVISYSLDSGDWMHEDDLAQMIKAFDNGLRRVDEEGNMLLIQHDTIRKSALDLTKHVLDRVRQRGWKSMRMSPDYDTVTDTSLAVTVGECLGDEPERWYREPAWISPSSISAEGCIVSGTKFCGTLRGFKTKVGCFKSNARCHEQVERCTRVSPDKTACERMEKICNLQFLFCTTCGGSKHSCDAEKFFVNKQA